MKLNLDIKYVLKVFLAHLFIAIGIWIFFYLILILPYNSNASKDELNILNIVALSFPFTYFFLSLFFIIKSFIEYKRQKIEIIGSIVHITTGALSIDTSTIPISQINNVDTNSTLLDSIFGLTNLSLTTDSGSVDINGINKKEAIAFSQKVASMHKLKISQ